MVIIGKVKIFCIHNIKIVLNKKYYFFLFVSKKKNISCDKVEYF